MRRMKVVRKETTGDGSITRVGRRDGSSNERDGEGTLGLRRLSLGAGTRPLAEVVTATNSIRVYVDPL